MVGTSHHPIFTGYAIIHGEIMSEITIDSDRLKEIFKSAIVELMHENKAEVSDFLAEILEDVAMEQAIVEGEATEIVSRESIFQLLERKV
jgi:hypothetical protein